MSDPDQLERELREYLDKEENLRRADRIVYLKSIFLKHFEFSKLDHVVNSKDIFDIVSNAKMEYTKLPLPLFVSRKQVDPTDLPHIAMLSSFISYLNKKHLLKKLVKFDFT